MEKSLPKLQRDTTSLKLFPFFTLVGWALIGFTILVSVLVLNPTAADYWGNNAKAVRDAAEAGSALLGQLALLSAWPKILEPLIILGVSAFIAGIALEFSAIPAILDRRAALLKQTLPLLGRK